MNGLIFNPMSMSPMSMIPGGGIGGWMGDYNAIGSGSISNPISAPVQSQFTGQLGAQPGSQAEWDAFNKVGFDQISNEGITGTMSGNTEGMTMGNLMGMGSGGAGGMASKFAQAQPAPDMSQYAQIQPLMAMATQGSGQQPYQNFIPNYTNPYIAGLMGV